MKKSLLIVISIVISFILVGCSNVKEPIYYSDNQVKNFVREAYGNSYNFIDKTSYIDPNGVVAYDYKFENNDGHIFSIFSRSQKNNVHGTESFVKMLKSNYIETKLNFKSKEIKDLIEGNGFKYNIDDNDISKEIVIYFNNYSDIDQLSHVVFRLYNIIDYRVLLNTIVDYHKDSKENIDYVLYIRCYLYLDDSQDIESTKLIDSFHVPYDMINGDDKLTQDFIKESLQSWYKTWNVKQDYDEN